MANIETEKNTKKVFTKKRLIIVGGALVLFFSAFAMGSSSAKVDIEEEKVSYEEIQEKIASATVNQKDYEAKVEELQDKIKSEEKKLKDKEKEVSEAFAAIENKSKIEEEANSIQKQIDSKRGEIKSLNKDIEAKKSELASIEGKIVEKKDAPVQLPAGQLVVGKDIQPGRYKVTAVGRGANFMVYDENGSNVVNTIIYSNPTSGGVSEYVTHLFDGYIIDAHSGFKYTPVE